MTFNQINYFLTVAEELNFTRAAASLFITQSTLSRSINALEQELGTKLLERDYHNVALTPAGTVMHRDMREIMGAMNGLIRCVQAMGSRENGRLVIGVLEGQEVESCLLSALRGMSDDFPEFSVDIRKMSHEELINEIKSNHLDIAETVIVPKMTAVDKDIEYRSIRMADNYLVARPDDPIWNNAPGLAALDGRTWLVPENFHQGIVSAQHCMERAGVAPIVKKASALEMQSLWLDVGMGVSICNDGHVIYGSMWHRALRAVRMDELPPVSIALLWNKGHSLPIREKFLEYVARTLADAEKAPENGPET